MRERPTVVLAVEEESFRFDINVNSGVSEEVLAILDGQLTGPQQH